MFWRRWTKEYLPTLQSSQKWVQLRKNLEVGDVVLVLEENTTRNLWPLARVVEHSLGKMVVCVLWRSRPEVPNWCDISTNCAYWSPRNTRKRMNIKDSIRHYRHSLRVVFRIGFG